MRRLKHAAEYALLRSVLSISARLPRPVAAWCGRRLGECVYHGLRIRRRVALTNLERTLGQFSGPAACERIALDAYRHLGTTLLEYGWQSRLDRAALSRVVEPVNLAALERAIRLGKGVILVTAHFGNWELLGAYVASLGYATHYLAKPQSNRLVDQYLTRTRGKQNVGIVYPGVQMRQVLRNLRDGGVLGVLADQDAGADGLRLDVLGQPASVFTGPAELARRTGAPILTVFLPRVGSGRYQAVFGEVLEGRPEIEAAADVERLTRAQVAAIERFIWRYPEQYYWVHRRWKLGRA